jgi:alkylated DNA nucleotide flippase Atl1
MSFTERVRAVVAAIPSGEVLTYGEVAVEAGVPSGARAVGNVMAVWGGDLPWWRVIRADGRVARGCEREAVRRLLGEGVPIEGHRVVR